MSEPILTSSDLADLRQLSESSLPHRARVLVPSIVNGPGGVAALVYPDVSSVPAVACRVQQATADVISRLRAEQVAARPVSVIVFSLDDIDEAQLVLGETQIVVDGETNAAAWSRTYLVIGVEPHRSYQSQRRAICVPADST